MIVLEIGPDTRKAILEWRRQEREHNEELDHILSQPASVARFDKLEHLTAVGRALDQTAAAILWAITAGVEG